MDTVLVVEDEKSISVMLGILLKKSGFNGVLAEDASAARMQIEQQIPDIILMDWMLPDISGVELIKRLRQENNTQHIPIIMLTARVSERDKLIGLKAGADDYMGKPFSLGDLIERIHQLLQRTPQIDEV